MAQASSRCECGNLKGESVECCVECAFLDGGKPGDADLIWALRALGGTATSYEIADWMECTQRTVLRALKRLRAAGRIYRFVAEGEVYGTHDGGARFVLCDVREQEQWQRMSNRHSAR